MLIDGRDILAKRIEEAGCADRRTGYFSEEKKKSLAPAGL